MGVHLPFIGYVRPSGARGNRLDPVKGSDNAKNIARIREVFECMREIPHDLLRSFAADPVNIDFGRAFEDILFETDDDERPALQRFMRRPGRKSLVIPSFDHLFDVRNPTVEEFAKTAVKTCSPIISLNEDKSPLTPTYVRLGGHGLMHRIMDNEINVRQSIISRFGRLEIRWSEDD